MSATVEVACLCGGIKETVQLDSTLPAKSITCSCTICRYCTGVLFISGIPLKGRPTFIDQLREYRSSEKVSRYFCPTCGSHMALFMTANSSWDVLAGVVERVVDQNHSRARLQQYRQHEFIGDTIDGGISVCLVPVQGEKIPIYMTAPDEGDPVTVVPGRRPSPFVSQSGGTASIEQSSDPPAAEKAGSEKLPASCQCGGVQFNVTRPNERSSECSAPWPDLIVPSSSGHSENPEDVKWWLRAAGSKYLAGTCACQSCRLESGVPIQTWAFVPKVNLQKLDGSRLDFTMGTLKQYNSSPGVYREFCGTCGATIFWHCDERPELIDVSVGVLRAPEGARAETWLEWWTERLSFREEAFDAQLAEEFEAGLHVLKTS